MTENEKSLQILKFEKLLREGRVLFSNIKLTGNTFEADFIIPDEETYNKVFNR